MIEFSPDGGNNWNTVATVGNTGSYSWTVPNALTNQAMIRVSNNGNPGLFDTCNANFTINLPTPNITSPNGGETYQSLNGTNITWDASSVASNVKIEYSLDSMLNWQHFSCLCIKYGILPLDNPYDTRKQKSIYQIDQCLFPFCHGYIGC
ncbi:MAG: hypothetical protein IPK03_10340 [Bacteroidetes bacterium]|nr:hypothetical protein [Bacteroidota bacterium]